MKKLVRESLNENTSEKVIKKVSFRTGLDNVEYIGNEKTEELKSKIEEFLKREITEKYGIEILNKGKVDLIKIKNINKYGFAFAISKFDENFKESREGQFRYKTVEVNKTIKKMINEFDLIPVVGYDRGTGVFVYNIFVK